ncbi:MAG: cytochrome c biogenesis protein DipZ, partial [Acidobacteriota bacterium]
ISYIVTLIPFNPEVLRYFAVVVIGFLGLTLVVPPLAQRLEAAVSRLSGRFGMVGQPQKTGFWSGLVTGFALGIVWTPCAGPILATIATLAATQAVNVQIVLVTIVYVIGVGIPLFIFATAGSALFTRSRFLSKYTGRIQQVFGVIMILTAVAIATNYDKVLQVKLLDAFPSYGNFINQLESNDAVQEELDKLKGQDSLQTQSANPNEQTNKNSDALFNADAPAPDFVGITKWLNLPEAQQSLTLDQLKGKVVLVDFWTYTCINCIRTLPYVTSWYDKYHNDGFVVVGVHTPEFAFEKETDNVLNAIKQYKIHYPVAQDNDYATWNNYSNRYWPAHYLIDANGIIRRVHFGEGEYEETEQAIQALLKESGQQVQMPLETKKEQKSSVRISPETYLGSERMQYYYPTAKLANGKHDYSLFANIPQNTFSLGGQWTIQDEHAVAGTKAVLNYNFTSDKVFLVMRPGAAQTTSSLKVFLDDKVVETKYAGTDVNNGIVKLDTDRLYNLIDLKGNSGNHILRLEFQTPGIEVFAFTFG